MVHQLQPKTNVLRVAHESEVLRLQKQIAALQEQIQALQQHEPITNHNREGRITLPVKGGYEIFDKNQIVLCVADGNYSKVYINSDIGLKPILISKTLKSIASVLASTQFIRCHQSYLINVKYISGYYRKNGLYLQLKNYGDVPVSRRKREEVMEIVTC